MRRGVVVVEILLACQILVVGANMAVECTHLVEGSRGLGVIIGGGTEQGRRPVSRGRKRILCL